MKITIYSNDKPYFERAMRRMSLKGFKLEREYSKRKYWLFGEITYYAEMSEPDLPSPFAPGGIVDRINNGEMIIATGGFPPPAFIQNLTTAKDFFKNLKEAIKDIKIPEEALDKKALLKALENALETEDYERAASIRDKLKETEK